MWKITTTVINQFDTVTGMIKSTRLVQGAPETESGTYGNLILGRTGILDHWGSGNLTHGVGTSVFFLVKKIPASNHVKMSE